jgi:hypothetical protein
VRLLEGAANGIPMVHIEGGVNTGLSGLGLATGFYRSGDDREEIDADARHYAYTSSNGLPSAIDPNDKLDSILSRVYCQGNGESRIVLWTWAPAGYGATATPSGVAGPFPFVIRNEAGAVTTDTTITLPHVVNVITVPGDANGTAWIIDVPGGFETYAFSFNSANNVANPALTWEVLYEATVPVSGAIAVPGVCGTMLNSCTSGTLDDIADSSTNYLWNCNGINGSTVNDSCSLPKPVNGSCGATVNACTSGTLNDITDSITHYLWQCLGQHGGTDALSCSLPIQNGSGLPDLARPNVSGLGSSYELGYTYPITVTVGNEGTASAGPSTLKVYQNTSSTPGGTLLYEQAVGALAPGQSTDISFVLVPESTCSIHVYCKFIFVADANNVVVESDENDNIYVRSMLRAR